MRKLLAVIGIILVLGVAFIFYHFAQTQSSYEGLPTVACLDYTEPIVQSFSFSVAISIKNKPYLLTKPLGHDYGNCLHEIFVNDSSGKVFVKTNKKESFTLGQFFDVWNKTFTQSQIFSYQVSSTDTLLVYVNNKPVSTYRNTIIKPNDQIRIVYE